MRYAEPEDTLNVNAMGYDFKICKLCKAHEGRPRYQLRDSTVHVCSSCNAHYIDYFDPPIPIIDPAKRDPTPLTEAQRAYFRDIQNHNQERLSAHVALVRQYRGLQGLRVLDIGSGGGSFLATLKNEGANVCGLEVYEPAATYARETYGIEAHMVPVEDEHWQSNYFEAFDVVTMWDVIEHVNFPRETIEFAANLLKPDGLMMMGTPCRDAFYHRSGSFTYKLSRGRFPTFLNMLYSSQPYAHKQILSVRDLETLFDYAGLSTLKTEIIMELSLPYEKYLSNILHSRPLARIGSPVVGAMFKILNIRNKMISVAQKPSS